MIVAAKKAPPSKAAPPKRKKASGPPQAEADRKNKLFALRLTPELRATVEAKAEAWGVGLGPAIVRLVEAGLAAEK